MTAELWGAVGIIVAAILTLGGVIWQARPKPEPLSAVVKSQSDEIVRLQGRISALEHRLDYVPTLESQRAQAVAGALILTNQIKALGHVPMWPIPAELLTGAKTAGG